jgi:hypothetical protein
MSNIIPQPPTGTLDLTNYNYDILDYDDQGNPLVQFGCDGSIQDMGSCPVDTTDNTHAYLSQYVFNLIAGYQSQEPTQPTAEVAALAGQSFTATPPETDDSEQGA